MSYIYILGCIMKGCKWSAIGDASPFRRWALVSLLATFGFLMDNVTSSDNIYTNAFFLFLSLTHSHSVSPVSLRHGSYTFECNRGSIVHHFDCFTMHYHHFAACASLPKTQLLYSTARSACVAWFHHDWQPRSYDCTKEQRESVVW